MQHHMLAPEAHLLPQLVRFTLQLPHALRGCCKLLASIRCASGCLSYKDDMMYHTLTLTHGVSTQRAAHSYVFHRHKISMELS